MNMVIWSIFIADCSISPVLGSVNESFSFIIILIFISGGSVTLILFHSYCCSCLVCHSGNSSSLFISMVFSMVKLEAHCFRCSQDAQAQWHQQGNWGLQDWRVTSLFGLNVFWIKIIWIRYFCTGSLVPLDLSFSHIRPSGDQTNQWNLCCFIVLFKTISNVHGSCDKIIMNLNVPHYFPHEDHFIRSLLPLLPFGVFLSMSCVQETVCFRPYHMTLRRKPSVWIILRTFSMRCWLSWIPFLRFTACCLFALFSGIQSCFGSDISQSLLWWCKDIETHPHYLMFTYWPKGVVHVTLYLKVASENQASKKSTKRPQLSY